MISITGKGSSYLLFEQPVRLPLQKANLSRMAQSQKDLDLAEDEEAVFSDVDPKIASPVAAALDVLTQLLMMYSIILKNDKKCKYPIRQLIDCQQKYYEAIAKLELDEGSQADDLTTKIALSCVRIAMPSKFVGISDETATLNTDRKSLSNLILQMSPLINAYSTTTGEALLCRAEQIAEDIAALNVGEIRSLFKPSVRRGKHPKPYTIAQIKYEFFVMRKILVASGISTYDINALYGKYALVAWDAVSRWRRTAGNLLAESTKLAIEKKINALLEVDKSELHTVAIEQLESISGRYKAAKASVR